MTTQEAKRMFEQYGEFLNVTQISKILGMKRETVRNKYLIGLPYLPNGKERLFYCGDIAKVIAENMKV